jgi:outer membrane protein assembly factor BamB
MAFRWIYVCALAALSLQAADWPQFRGPGAAGVAAEESLPETFGPEENLVWKTPLPPGHSSPVVSRDRVFVTAVDGETLLTIALERATGRIVWQVEAPRDRVSSTHEMNNSAAPTPVSDGESLYVFFGDFGLISYDWDGQERWRLPMGPFNNGPGMSSSPVIAHGRLIVNCDSQTGSYMMAVDPANGEIIWKADRAEFTRGYSTPIVYEPDDGPAEVIVPGAFQLAGYSLDDGAKLWWARGMCWQPKSLAVQADGRVYAHCWAAGGDKPPEKLYPPFADALAELDGDHDGKISKQEFYPERAKQFGGFDLDHSKKLEQADWEYFRAKNSSRNALIAVRLGGRGDVTESHIEWEHTRSLPNVPSPLLYDGVLYLVKDGGIVTAIDAASGKVHKIARLSGAMGQYFASPVAADGKIFFFDGDGSLSVVKAGPQWELLHTVVLGEGGNSTPAIADGRIYVRTHENLYCFGKAD